jgi:hypothetical protein
VGSKANGRWVDQFEDRFGTYSDTPEVEASGVCAKSFVELAVLNAAQVLRILLLTIAVLTGVMIGSYAVSNENGFVASLNLMLTIFDFFGALILLRLDR